MKQKHAIRVINFKDRYTHAAPLFLDINALNIYKLNIYNILCLVYKCKNKTCPPVFHNIYTEKPPNKYCLRNNGILQEPRCKTKISQFGVNYRAPHLWNKLILEKKNDISNYEYFPLFQLELKEYVLSLDNIEQFF